MSTVKIISRLNSRTLFMGWAFLFIGVVASYLFLGLAPFDPLNCIVLVFPFIGIIALFSGGWLVVRKDKSISAVGGVFSLFRAVNLALDQVKHVQVARRVYKTDKRSYVYYALEMVLNDGRSFSLGEYGTVFKSRNRAEKIAKILQTGCWDRVSQSGEHRKFNELDLSLQQRLKSNPVTAPAAQSITRIKLERKPGEVIFQITKKGFTKSDAVELIVSLVTGVTIGFFAGYVVYKLYPLFFWLLILIIVTGPVLWRTYGTENLLISRSKFVIIYSLFGFSLKSFILLDKVEEIVDYNSSLVLRSDHKELRFGETLDPRERNWLRGMICYEVQNF